MHDVAALPTTTDTSTMERRKGPPKSQLGELVIESSWRPTDRPNVESDAWLRAHGYAPDRRQR